MTPGRLNRPWPEINTPAHREASIQEFLWAVAHPDFSHVTRRERWCYTYPYNVYHRDPDSPSGVSLAAGYANPVDPDTGREDELPPEIEAVLRSRGMYLGAGRGAMAEGRQL